MRLAGRRILIAGAASGIGRATAERFRAEGAALALLDRDADGLAALAADLAGAGPDVATGAVDVASEARTGAAVADLAARLGGLDGIVVSTGIDLLRPFAEMTGAEWRQVLDVNLSGPFHLCRAGVPHLRAAGGGTIVHVASGAALRPLEARTAYCASKAGLVMFAKSLAVDLAPDGIRVNAVCPGIIDTPLFRASWDGAEHPAAELDRILDRYLIREIGKPGDIANAILFLSCAESSHVTGSALAVDGGRAFH